ITRPPTGESPSPTGMSSAAAARERLASRLAVALADPALRADFARRFAQSDAPEGKLQFQRLARADGNRLLTMLATRGGGTVREMLDDLVAARDLEVYLPVQAHRAAWNGGEEYLVATLERDDEQPTAFDRHGTRSRLSPTRPPAVRGMR
ncbi:MAG TPA: hypothetical protein PLL69_10130, partial [Gemmatimonadales bacterium]|nr:hypothetical protein [Gemmatimonadales bacterium]